MEGVFAAAHYRHVPAAIEKGVTGGTVADAVALKTRQPRDAGHGPGCTGGEDDSIRRVISVERLHREFIGIGQAHGLGGDELDAHRLGPLDALPLRLGTGDAVSYTHLDVYKRQSCIILSRTQTASEEKIAAAVALLREKNPTATIVTTAWDALTGEQILKAMSTKNDFKAELIAMAAKANEEHSHEDEEEEHHHHHHHYDENGVCTCGHHHDEDDDDDEDEEHEHHHHHDHEMCIRDRAIGVLRPRLRSAAAARSDAAAAVLGSSMRYSSYRSPASSRASRASGPSSCSTMQASSRRA